MGAPAAASRRPADYVPFQTRAQAEAVLGGFCRGAQAAEERFRTSDPRGIATTAFLWKLEALTDTCQSWLSGAEPSEPSELGAYELEVLEQIARLLDPIAVRVLISMIERTAHDGPET
jgi:hypothetical protein